MSVRKRILKFIDRGNWKHSWHLPKGEWGIDWYSPETKSKLIDILSSDLSHAVMTAAEAQQLLEIVRDMEVEEMEDDCSEEV